MTTNQELLSRREQAVARGVGNIYPIFTERAENAELWDVEGNRYIDFASGIAVVNTGHNHPKIKAAVTSQIEKFSHTCFQVVQYEPYIELAERLNAVVPGAADKKTLFLTTGAEAVENAIKISRYQTGRPGVIAFSGAFHGRTMLGMALTGKVVPYKAGFGPFPPDIYHAPFPMEFHGITEEYCLAVLDNLFKSEIDPKRVAAMIIEPVLGEGGFYIAPPSFLQALRSICDEHGIILVIDEIQTGFARTGKMFAIEHSGVEPDVMIMAKSLAGGYPLSAVTGKSEIINAPEAGGLGGTYAGSPLGCVAALAVLDIIEEEGLIERANEIGKLITDRIKEIKNDTGRIGEVRTLGAMTSMEMITAGSENDPDADLTKALVQAVGKEGLILLPCGVKGNVIRYLVPLTASDALINEGMDILSANLNKLI